MLIFKHENKDTTICEMPDIMNLNIRLDHNWYNGGRIETDVLETKILCQFLRYQDTNVQARGAVIKNNVKSLKLESKKNY